MHKSMLEVAVATMKRKRNPQLFSKIYDEVAQELEFTEEEKIENYGRFYNDLSLSALFVYTGDNNWDLKERQPADMWDKDASFFIDPEELKARKAERLAEKIAEREARKELETIVELEQKEEVREEEDFTYNTEEDILPFVDEEEDDTIDFSADADPEEFGDDFEDTEEETTDDMDEDSYNEIMDDYEDLYDDEK